MKRCSVCNETKPFEFFHARKKSADGLQSACKECNKVRIRMWRRRVANLRRAMWGPKRHPANIEELLQQLVPREPVNTCGKR